LEIEFAGTVKKTMSRRQELKDITTGLDRMMALKRAREDRLVFIDTFLDFQRQYLVSGGGGVSFLRPMPETWFILSMVFHHPVVHPSFNGVCPSFNGVFCPSFNGYIIQWCFFIIQWLHHPMVFVHHSMVTSSNGVFCPSFNGYIIQWCLFIIQWLHHPMVFVHHSMVTSSNGVFFIIQWLHHPIVFFHRSLVFFHHPMVLPSSSNRSSSLSPFSLSPTFPPPPPPSSSSAARRRRRHQHQRSQPNVQNHQRQICGGGTRAFQNGQEASLGGSA
jgi:hypothetical protein